MLVANVQVLPPSELYGTVTDVLVVEEFTDYDSVVVFSDVGRAYIAKFFVISH